MHVRVGYGLKMYKIYTQNLHPLDLWSEMSRILTSTMFRNYKRSLFRLKERLK